MRQSKVQKREIIIITIFFIQSRCFGGLFPSFSGFWKVSEGNTLWHSYERGDREECSIVFSSLTLQNPEEGRNKPPKHQLWIKKIVIIITLFWTLDCLIKIHQRNNDWKWFFLTFQTFININKKKKMSREFTVNEKTAVTNDYLPFLHSCFSYLETTLCSDICCSGCWISISRSSCICSLASQLSRSCSGSTGCNCGWIRRHIFWRAGMSSKE